MADKFPDGDSRTSILFGVYNHSLVVMQYMLPLIILSFTYGRVAYVLKQKDSIGDTRHYDNLKAKRKVTPTYMVTVKKTYMQRTCWPGSFHLHFHVVTIQLVFPAAQPVVSSTSECSKHSTCVHQYLLPGYGKLHIESCDLLPYEREVY
uniref:Uncharacterized protein n=1 Tax=Ditylenchus dipsaci TaxID=166011 RepID=A0A915D055_9BILA